ncbi:phosphotransferase [Shewanella sp. GXUN23E]|uniref:phosphotransferase n=1 Tax=Shewanella sp. GXUN23E TaxID=3422498 RepID=UPI003D7E324C
MLAKLMASCPGLGQAIAGLGYDRHAPLCLLSSGLSNDNYVLGQGAAPRRQHCHGVNDSHSEQCDGALSRLALRVNRDVAALGVGRVNEVWAWRQAASAGLAPALVWVSQDYHCYLSQYVPNEPPESTNTADSDSVLGRSGAMIVDLLGARPPSEPSNSAVSRLGNLLCQLATLPVPELTISTLEQWQRYDSALKAGMGDAPEGVQQGIYRILERRTQILDWITTVTDAQQGRLQFCHRDLNPANLLWSAQKCLAIDFEYTCGAGPLNELATVLATHNWSAPDTHWLCHEYLSKLGYATLPYKAIVAAVNIYWVFSCCWALLQAAVHQEPQYMTWFSQSELMLS